MLKNHVDISPSTPCPYPVPVLMCPVYEAAVYGNSVMETPTHGTSIRGTGYGQGVDGDISPWYFNMFSLS